MPLTHLLATAACLVAAGLVLLHARDRATRVAHAVMLAAMVAMTFSMEHAPAIGAMALVLCVLGLVLHRRDDVVRRAVALDAWGCAALLAITGAATAGRPMASMNSAPDGRLVAAVAAVLLAWAVVSWRLTPRRGWVGWGAGVLMLLGMGAMGVV